MFICPFYLWEMGNLKDGNSIVSAVVSDEAKDFFAKAKRVTGWTVSAIAGEVLKAWNDGRTPVIAGYTESELRAKIALLDADTNDFKVAIQPAKPQPEAVRKASPQVRLGKRAS